MAKQQRGEESKGLTRVQGVDASYLTRYAQADSSLAGMDQYVIVPRLKLVQLTADEQTRQTFGEGSVIVKPGDALVVKKNEPFEFVPFLFFTEWCKWADRKDKESPAIISRSYDPTSDLAKRAANPDLRYEYYPDQEKKKNDKDKLAYRYVQHFCFPGIIYGEHTLSGTEATLSFERGEFGQGRSFISAVKLQRQEVILPRSDVPEDQQARWEDMGDGNLRTRVPIPLFAQRWMLTPKFRDKGDKKWYGFDFQPSEPRVVPEFDLEKFFGRHKDLALALEEKKLVVDHGDVGTEEEASAAVPAGKDY